MGKRLYIGNLSYNTTDESLRELFAKAGTVLSAEVVRDRYTDRSKGFGFVEMESAEDADKATSEYDGTTLDGREIKVSEARPRREGPRDFDRGGDRGGPRDFDRGGDRGGPRGGGDRGGGDRGGGDRGGDRGRSRGYGRDRDDDDRW
jgi:cold-inducible RNA-binding protein